MGIFNANDADMGLYDNSFKLYKWGFYHCKTSEAADAGTGGAHFDRLTEEALTTCAWEQGHGWLLQLLPQIAELTTLL